MAVHGVVISRLAFHNRASARHNAEVDIQNIVLALFCVLNFPRNFIVMVVISIHLTSLWEKDLIIADHVLPHKLGAPRSLRG